MALYHDPRPTSRVFHATFVGDTLTLLRQDPDFHQRTNTPSPVRRAGARPPGTWIIGFPYGARPGRRTESVRRVSLVSKEMVASRELGASQVLRLSQTGSSADRSTNQDLVRIAGGPPPGGSGATVPLWTPFRGESHSKDAYLTFPVRRDWGAPNDTTGIVIKSSQGRLSQRVIACKEQAGSEVHQWIVYWVWLSPPSSLRMISVTPRIMLEKSPTTRSD